VSNINIPLPEAGPAAVIVSTPTASPGSALHLWNDGYTDLVCVVPPGAHLAPNTSISHPGKVPGLKGADGWHGYKWRAHKTTESDAERWDKWGANIGVRGDQWPAVDIDVDDEALALGVQRVAHRVLGPAPVRRSTGSRRLLPYRTAEPFPRIAVTVNWRGETHKIEILAAGRQYLIAGTHPTGTAYRWEQPLPMATNLTLVDREKAELFLTELQRELCLRMPGIKVERTNVGAAVAAPAQDELLAPSLEALDELVAGIPNREEDRDGYVRFGHAIRAAGGDGAAYIFAEWAERWEDGHNDPDTVERDYAGFRGPYRLGWDWLVRYAHNHAPISARDEFEADPAAVPPPTPSAAYASALATATLLKGLPVDLPPKLIAVADAARSLPPVEQRVVIGSACLALRGMSYTHSEAQEMYRAAVISSMDRGGETRTLTELLNAPSNDVEWLADGLLSVGGSSIIGGAPKVGKTTLARELVAAVVDGRRWLDREVMQSRVLYLSLEDHVAHVASEFARLEVGNPDDLLVRTGAPTDPLQWIRADVEARGTRLVVVDTLQKLLRVADMNDYASVVSALTPYTELAKEQGFHFAALHHSKKGRSDDVLEMMLGSTGLVGAVDTVVGLTRDAGGQRHIATRQRMGEDLPWSQLNLDYKTHRSSLGETKGRATIEKVADDIRLLLEDEGPMSEKIIRAHVTGSTSNQNDALRDLLKTGHVIRTGKGHRSSPYVYEAVPRASAAERILDEFTGTDMYVAELLITPQAGAQ
jgi:hypothetical protein